MKKINNTLIIDTAGQWTVVIPNKRASQQLELSKSLMNQLPLFGQVAYINSLSNETPQIKFMGEEFSVNGTMAVAAFISNYQKQPKVDFTINAIPISGFVEKNRVSITFPKTIITNQKSKLIVFEGISYQLINSPPNYFDDQITRFTNSNTPASGLIYYQQNRIWPVIFVKQTNTCIWETACGSASLALYLLRSINQVTQPSGQTISIDENYNEFQISADYQLISQGVLK